MGSKGGEKEATRARADGLSRRSMSADSIKY